jgi:hypothetical protein
MSYNKLIKLQDIFKPVMYHGLSGGDMSISASLTSDLTTDILGMPRYMKGDDVSCNRGPYEMSDTNFVASAGMSAYEFSISGVGQERFKIIAATGDLEVTFEAKSNGGVILGTNFFLSYPLTREEDVGTSENNQYAS